ncbi:MAG TPA: hypothetical protein ENK75_03570, partial [Saprospiraceae bacterium]|nr:hypothetical protein [Saprospiraceae bacterium]
MQNNNLGEFHSKTVLKIIKKAYSLIVKKKKVLPKCIQDADVASNLLFKELNSNKPVMVARFGSTELINIVNFLGVTQKKYHNYLSYIRGQTPAWWWQEHVMKQLEDWSGFFPPSQEKITQFCEMMIEDSKEVDILGSWLEDEKLMSEYMHDKKVHLRFLEPFWNDTPWTKVLKDKRVLVIHPFKYTIEKQYENRESLFKNKDVLPQFKSLRVIRAVQSLGGNSEFKDWFEALDYMKDQIDQEDYDICLIGAGAYGFPLAAHVKRIGKQAVHMGGALQLLFGIIGKRWEDPMYGVNEWGIQENFY